MSWNGAQEAAPPLLLAPVCCLTHARELLLEPSTAAQGKSVSSAEVAGLVPQLCLGEALTPAQAKENQTQYNLPGKT